MKEDGECEGVGEDGDCWSGLSGEPASPASQAARLRVARSLAPPKPHRLTADG